MGVFCHGDLVMLQLLLLASLQIDSVVMGCGYLFAALGLDQAVPALYGIGSDDRLVRRC